MKLPKIKNRISAIILALAIAVSGYLYSKYSYLYVMSWDVYGYYLYLPQTFINNDLAMENDSVVTQSADPDAEAPDPETKSHPLMSSFGTGEVKTP